MQPINTTLPSVALDVRSARVLDILQNLQQAGLFKAIVIKQTGNQVLLDTAFGNITGKAPDQLKTGDEILARVTTLQPQPTLKIEQHTPKLLTLAKSQFKGLALNLDTTVLAAKVVSHTNNHTQLKINNQIIQINRQQSLQEGETLLLKDAGKNQLQLIRIQPQTILKAALSSLIPRAINQGQKYNLSSLQKISSELADSKSAALIDRANLKSMELAQQYKGNPEASQTSPNRLLPSISPGIPGQTKLLQDILHALAKPLASIENFKPEVLQQIFSYLALIKTDMPGNMNNLGQQLQYLSLILKQSPESFRQLVQEIFVQSATPPVKARQLYEGPVSELSSTLRLEILQQTDQTLNQLLIQQSSARLQLDQQQPLNLILNIPVQMDQQSQDLLIKIKQKKKNQSDESLQYWEIELSFEFGLLGMITTRILLQESKISANFWAYKADTKNLIDTHMDQFKSQLQKAGFELGLFDCFNGPAPASSEKEQYFANDNLLDLQA